MRNLLRTTLEAHWNFANSGSWDRFAALLHPELRYECPQNREYINGAVGYLDLFRTWPGDWTANDLSLICDETQGVSIIDFLTDFREIADARTN